MGGNGLALGPPPRSGTGQGLPQEEYALSWKAEEDLGGSVAGGCEPVRLLQSGRESSERASEQPHCVPALPG